MSTVGLVLRRTARDTQVEPYFHRIVAGLEDVLLPEGIRVLTRTVDDAEEEADGYRRWAQRRSVVGVVLTNLSPDDSRPEALRSLGLPAVILGEPARGTGAAVIRAEGHGAMVDAVRHCVGLGHRRIGHVSGPRALQHTQSRARAFAGETAAAGVVGAAVEADYSADGGVEAALALLRRTDPPTAIVFDNDLMAVAAAAALPASGVRVPEDVSIIAWDDSVLCRLSEPPLSAMSHDVHEVGVLAGTALLALLRGGAPMDVVAPAPVFVARASTSSVRASAPSSVL